MTVVRVGTAEAPDGAVLGWRIDGGGPIALAACNGIGVSTFFWRGLAEHFGATGKHAFLTWDYRGHGRSPVPEHPEDMTVAQCARDLWVVLAGAGIERAILLGHSLGSQVILEAWRQRSASVQALIPMLGAAGKVFSTFLGRSEPLLRLLIEVGSANAGPAAQALRAVLQIPGVWKAMRALKLVHPDLCPREAFDPYFEHLRQLDLRGYFALARDLLSHDASDLLPGIQTPVLVVAGERDLFVSPERSRELAEKIPGAELLLLREGSHAAMVEQPELLALSVEKFLAAHHLA